MTFKNSTALELIRNSPYIKTLRIVKNAGPLELQELELIIETVDHAAYMRGINEGLTASLEILNRREEEGRAT